jgi:hypothetical protein
MSKEKEIKNDVIMKAIETIFDSDHVGKAKFLTDLSDEEFKAVKRIFIDAKIKFSRTPVFDHTFFNINLLKEFNTVQLKFLSDLIHQELKERGDL